MTKSDKQGADAVLRFSDHKRKRVDEFEKDVDALFSLPLPEFTGARNALAAQLKKSGRSDEAAQVKSLAKPSISAWAVNQLYWDHREDFEQLIALGERFQKAQKSGKVAEMRTALDARRQALTELSDLAAAVLRDAGNNPAPDTIHRITTTLEGLSAYAAHSDGPRPGRLTSDVDPPGFESLAGFVPGTKKQEAVGSRQTAATRSQKSKHLGKPSVDDHPRRLEETRKAKLAAARVSLQDAKRSLNAARARAQSLEAAQKKAHAEAKKAEQHRREVEASLEKAKAAAEGAARRARSVEVEVKTATSAVEDAEATLEAASEELESLLQNSNP